MASETFIVDRPTLEMLLGGKTIVLHTSYIRTLKIGDSIGVRLIDSSETYFTRIKMILHNKMRKDKNILIQIEVSYAKKGYKAPREKNEQTYVFEPYLEYYVLK